MSQVVTHYYNHIHSLPPDILEGYILDGMKWGDIAQYVGDADGPAILPLYTTNFTLQTISVFKTVKASGGDFTNVQAAWNWFTTYGRSSNSAIVIDAGYDPGDLVTGSQSGDDTYWMYIMTANYSNIPRHIRVNSTDKSEMPQMVIPAGQGSIQVGSTTSKVRFIGISIEWTSGSYMTHAAWVENGAEYIIFDRCLIKGLGLGGEVIRGIRLEGSNVGIIDSYIYDIVASGSDTQAIWIYIGDGPFTIVNNYLSATGENMMIGGATAPSADDLPRDITITRNYFHKPSAWQSQSSMVSVKNLFEIKHGLRFLIEKNIFENNWVDSQTGKAIIFKVDPQTETGGDWTETGHVTFRYNKVINSPCYLQIAGLPEGHGVPVNNVSIHDNLAYKIGTLCDWPSGDLRAYMMSGPTGGDISIHNETVIVAGSSTCASFFGDEMNAWEQYDCIVGYCSLGWKGDSVGIGTPTFEAYCGDYSWHHMSTFGYGSAPSLATYPDANNNSYDDVTACGFENPGSYDYRLSSGSALKGTGSGGSDPGCDIVTLNTYLAHVVDGDFSGDEWDT